MQRLWPDFLLHDGSHLCSQPARAVAGGAGTMLLLLLALPAAGGVVAALQQVSCGVPDAGYMYSGHDIVPRVYASWQPAADSPWESPHPPLPLQVPQHLF
eukprot:COSAG01_NODE_623_length_14742_cov_22.391177_21_plen_99_part_01